EEALAQALRLKSRGGGWAVAAGNNAQSGIYPGASWLHIRENLDNVTSARIARPGQHRVAAALGQPQNGAGIEANPADVGSVNRTRKYGSGEDLVACAIVPIHPSEVGPVAISGGVRNGGCLAESRAG